MMLYKLKNNERQFKQLRLDAYQLSEQLGLSPDGDSTQGLEDCLNLGIYPKPFPHPWGKVQALFEAMPMYRDAVQIPNLSIWKGSALLLSDKAHAYLKNILEEHGEFLPINVQGFTYYIFNLTTVGKIDIDNSVFVYDEGCDLASDIQTLLFDENDIKDKFLFTATHDYLGGVFCTDDFKSTCEEFDLDGLYFDVDIVSSV